ncbi:hypothetical protein MKW92_014798 [Papaver armeniacum]|nr:hypothetical protein MKW92_014798 [Papaver armeniacum]
MAFWGVTLKKEKPYTHKYNSSLGRLRISQATLRDYCPWSGSVVVQCRVGNSSPVSLCSMHTDTQIESCMLDIELEKEIDVVFEVIGNRSLHLTGFYLGHSGAVGNYGVRSTFQAACVKTELNVSEMGENLEYKDTKVDGRNIRTMASGLVIEEIKTSGNPKIASHGLYVEIYYFGQIKSTGYIFESNYADHYKRFRLGNGDVIKGLEVGVNGMHVGDKKRITIPPSMARSDVPADAWLVFEVDLKDV